MCRFVCVSVFVLVCLAVWPCVCLSVRLIADQRVHFVIMCRCYLFYASLLFRFLSFSVFLCLPDSQLLPPNVRRCFVASVLLLLCLCRCLNLRLCLCLRLRLRLRPHIRVCLRTPCEHNPTVTNAHRLNSCCPTHGPCALYDVVPSESLAGMWKPTSTSWRPRSSALRNGHLYGDGYRPHAAGPRRSAPNSLCPDCRI